VTWGKTNQPGCNLGAYTEPSLRRGESKAGEQGTDTSQDAKRKEREQASSEQTEGGKAHFFWIIHLGRISDRERQHGG